MKKNIFISGYVIFVLLVSVSISSGVVNNDVYYYYSQGLIKAQSGNYDSAVKSYLMALNQDKDNPEIYISQAEACIGYIESLKNDKSVKARKYLNMAIACIRMTEHKVAEYDKGQNVNLFTAPYDRTIRDIKKRLISVKSRINDLKKQMGVQEKPKVVVVRATPVKKQEPIKKVQPVTPKPELLVQKEESTEEELKVDELEKKVEAVASVPVVDKTPETEINDIPSGLPDDHLINLLKKSNGKLQIIINKNKMEIASLNKKMQLLEAEYTSKGQEDNPEYLTTRSRLEEKIKNIENKVTIIEKNYIDQIAQLKLEIAKARQEKVNTSYKVKEEETILNNTGSKIIFGSSLLTSLIILLIL